MSRKRFGAVPAILALLLLTIGQCLAAEPIRIGAFLSVTGPVAFLGDPELKTLHLYVDRINAEGGLLGRKLELVSYDDNADAGKANTFAKRLIEDDRVDVIIGGTTTGTSMAALPLAEKAGVPFIALASGVGIVEPVRRWVFKTPHTDRMAAQKVFVDMQSRGIRKIALITESSGYGQSGRKESLAEAPKYGIEVVADETFGQKDTDVTTQLAKVRNVPGVQAIFVHGGGQGPAVLTRNYAQLGLKLPLYQSHGVASDEYIKLSGAAAEGVRLPSSALLVAGKLPDGDAQKALLTAYRKAYESRYKSDASTFGGHAYTALLLYTDAVNRARSTDKEKVRTALEQTGGLMGANGSITMSATDHMGLDLNAFRMLEIRKGDWTLLP